MSKEIKRSKRDTVFVELGEFCSFAKEHDYMEVTLWTNGEGYDVSMEDQMFHLTYGQLKALRKMVKKLEKPEKVRQTTK
jgi:hypothetical protein